MSARTALAAFAALVGLSTAAECQAPVDAGPSDGVVVLGHVVDRATGRDLPAVRVVLSLRGAEPDSAGATRWEARSDSAGAFVIDSLRSGEYEMDVQALGYAPLSRSLTLAEDGSVELRVELSPEALDLEPIVVTVTRPAWLMATGFYERRDGTSGYSLTRAEVEARNPHRLSDLFYMIPGADVIDARDGYSQAVVLLRGRCQPQVVLDGAPFSAPIPIDQVLSVDELEAVEVYHGATGPVRYSNSSCGTIMLWSRRGGTGGGSLSWTRIITGLVVVSWITLTTLFG